MLKKNNFFSHFLRENLITKEENICFHNISNNRIYIGIHYSVILSYIDIQVNRQLFLC